jgi:hypothetical protein
MKTLPLPILLAFLACASTASGSDLSQINRVIAKEPAYHSKPRYCLLVFGPEAKTRVWLVQDGDTLYVDRNGNGDLTEPSKKVQAEKRDAADEGTYTFNIGKICDGRRVHEELALYISKIDYLADSDESVKAFLTKYPHGRGYRLFAEVEMPGWKGACPGGRVRQQAFYSDTNGVLQFADRPQIAPVIHFGGPWHVVLFSQPALMIGRERDVFLGVGTPGMGPGTTAYIDYDGVIPETLHPTIEITYPVRGSDGAIQKVQYLLKQRC